MAFNPFNVFRRNQKVLFAIITVFVMFTFVLSFGRGDFFDWLPRWLGSKSRTGDVLATIDGKKVYESEVHRVQTKRTLANQYMSAAAERASQNLAGYVKDGLTRVSTENKPVIQQVLATRPYYVSPRTAQLMANPQMFQQFMQLGLISPEQIAQERDQMMPFLASRLREIANAKAPKENDLDVAKSALSLMALDQTLMPDLFTPTRGQYFLNQPNRTNKDAMEFLLWLREADKLGVEFTDDGVSELVNNEFFRRLTNDDLKAVEENLKGKSGYTPESLKEALRDEFKVRAAQAAVLGPDAIRPDGRLYDSPYDFYQFYKEQTTAARYGFITVPAENYLGKVQGQPSEAELLKIFREGRTVEPNPASPKIGLKEPRKLKLEWVELTGTEPYYKAAAADAVKKAGILTRANGFLALASALGGVTDAALLGAPAALALPDPVLDAKYDEYKQQHQQSARSNWYSPPFFGAPQPLDTAYARPENAGAVVSAAATAGEAYESDRRARLATLPAALIPPVALGWGVPEVMIAAAAVQAKATRPLPLDAIRSKLAARAEEDIARTIAREDLTNLEKELGKLNLKPGSDLAPARTLIETFIKEKGAKHGQSEQFHDQFTILNDPGLKPLKEKALGRTMGGYVDLAGLGGQFFFDFDPLTRQRQPATALYKPEAYPNGSLFGVPSPTEPALLVWRSAEEPERVLRDVRDPEARAKAEAAWRRLKARELAKQAADELAKKCDHLGNSFAEIEQKVRDARAQFAGTFPSPDAQARVSYFEQDGVAALVSTPLPMAGMPRSQVAPFHFVPSEYVPYPTPKMAEELIQARDRPLSSTLVLTDQPEDRYYVAVLLDKTERPVALFEHEVYGPSSALFGDLGPAVSRRHQEELRKHAREDAVALLKAQFKYDQKSDKVDQKAESTEE